MSDDSTPDTSVGAHSASDNAPAQTIGDVSAASLANAMRDALTGDTGNAAAVNAGVTQTVTQTPAPGFPPVVFHYSQFGYDLPLG